MRATASYVDVTTDVVLAFSAAMVSSVSYWWLLLNGEEAGLLKWVPDSISVTRLNLAKVTKNSTKLAADL